MIDDPCASNQPTLNYVRCTAQRCVYIRSHPVTIILFLFRYFAFESLQVLKVAYSQKVFNFVFNLQIGTKSQSWALSTSREDAQDRDLADLVKKNFIKLNHL